MCYSYTQVTCLSDFFIIHNMDTFLIQKCANLSNEAYNDKITLIPDSTFIENPKYDTQLHIAKENNILYVIGRGTSSKKDVIQDIKIARSKCSFINNTMIHCGFLQQYESIRDELNYFINKYINENCNIYKIVFTAHSLGNAVATIGAIDFKLNNKYKDKIVECISFASPRIGCSKFAKLFNTNVNISHRVVLHRDPVTFVPFCLRFKHIKGCIHLKKDGTTHISDDYFFPIGCWVNQHFMDAYVERIHGQFISSQSSGISDNGDCI